jgi:hypothetical protein
MKTLRNASALVVLFAVLALSSDLLAGSAYCADCGNGGAVDHQCTQEEITDLNSCCQTFGCNSGWSVNYCADRSQGVYNGCAILAGCPNLAY